jgi:hypothetical protein
LWVTPSTFGDSGGCVGFRKIGHTPRVERDD